jgi:hypothetical protein
MAQDAYMRLVVMAGGGASAQSGRVNLYKIYYIINNEKKKGKKKTYLRPKQRDSSRIVWTHFELRHCHCQKTWWQGGEVGGGREKVWHCG